MSFTSNAAAVSTVARQGGYFWTTPEVATLSQLWDGGRGLELLVRALPGRSQSAIEQKAADIGLPRVDGVGSTSTRANDAVDDEIRGAYADGSRGAVQKLSESLGVPPWWISRRAGQLGLVKARLKEADWCSAELGILARCVEGGPAQAHRELRLAGYERSVGAVASKLKSVKSKSSEDEALSARDLAKLMGVDEKAVVRWISHSGLEASRSGASWHIKPQAFKAWVVSHPRMISLRGVDALWFIDLISNQ